MKERMNTIVTLQTNTSNAMIAQLSVMTSRLLSQQGTVPFPSTPIASQPIQNVQSATFDQSLEVTTTPVLQDSLPGAILQNLDDHLMLLNGITEHTAAQFRESISPTGVSPLKKKSRSTSTNTESSDESKGETMMGGQDSEVIRELPVAAILEQEESEASSLSQSNDDHLTSSDGSRAMVHLGASVVISSTQTSNVQDLASTPVLAVEGTVD